MREDLAEDMVGALLGGLLWFGSEEGNGSTFLTTVASLAFFLFVLSLFSEVVGLTAFGTEKFKLIDAIFTVMLGVSLGIGFLWALIFEPVSHRFDVKLTQSAMRNEYYKSRNAMAYYGPAVVNADGEVDIAAAAEQAQACLSCRC